MNLIDEIEQFKNIQKLKFTYRLSWRTLNWEKESTAWHTWCMMVVADYLLEKLNQICPWKYNLDKLKIYEMIVYHDLLESETGDVDLDPSASDLHKNKEKIEKETFPIFLEKIPKELRKIYSDRLHEYEDRQTLESRFVKLVDVIECEYQCAFQKDLWENWTKDYFVEKREKHFNFFPELKYIFYETLEFFEKNKYFSQRGPYIN